MEVSDEGRGIHPEIQSKVVFGKSAEWVCAECGKELNNSTVRWKFIPTGTAHLFWSRYRSPRKPFRPTRATRTAPKTSIGEAKPCDGEL
jgi:hypothetical protein